MEFKVHDDMSIAKVSLKELFSNSRTKSQQTKILAEALLEEFKGRYQELVVSYDDKVKSNRSHMAMFTVTGSISPAYFITGNCVSFVCCCCVAKKTNFVT